MVRNRNYCFTLNNYTEDEYQSIITIECRYLIVGREIGEQGTPHLQGYVAFRDAISFENARRRLVRAHITVALGDALSNFEYCSKSGSFLERGSRPGTPKDGGRCEIERWDAALAAARKRDFDSVPSDIYIRYVKSLEYIAAKHSDPPVANEPDSKNRWYYGGPGTGKSRAARELGGGADGYLGVYIKEPNDKWWDGYIDQQLVIIDDFDKYNVKQSGDLKRWLDIYPFQAQTKGGMHMIRPKCIVVTSNYHPEEIWDDEMTRAAIARRCVLTRFEMPFGK